MRTEAPAILFNREQTKKPIVVVVGCGFGGLQAAMHFVKLDIELVVIDRTNHHLFQPLLYQVSTAALSPADIASPIRTLLGSYPNVSVILGEVEGVDKAGRKVRVRGTGTIDYDYLILATGCAYAWFGHDEWEGYAAVLKTLPDALQIRRRVLEAYDWAESRTDPDEVRALTTFVVIGGGPTGVELSGSLAELARSTLKSDYRHIDPTKARIILIDMAPRLLAEFPQALSDYTAKALDALGVEVHLKASCECIDARGVVVNGQRIDAANVFWAAGTRANPAAQWLDAPAARNNAVEVTADCSVPGHPEIFAIGDVSSYKTAGGKPLPGLAPVAKQQGAYVAKVVASRIGARPPSRTVRVPQPRHDGGDRPLARDRDHRGRQADRAGRLARLVARAPPAPDRLPQPAHGVHQLGVGLLHLRPRRAPRRGTHGAPGRGRLPGDPRVRAARCRAAPRRLGLARAPSPPPAPGDTGPAPVANAVRRPWYEAGPDPRLSPARGWPTVSPPRALTGENQAVSILTHDAADARMCVPREFHGAARAADRRGFVRRRRRPRHPFDTRRRHAPGSPMDRARAPAVVVPRPASQGDR